MEQTVLILEARKEVSEALQSVIASANFIPIVVQHLERLSDLSTTPAAIVVRIAFEGASDPPHAALERLADNRPPIIAIAWEEDELEEARRLKCDVILHAPRDICRLCDTLARLIHT
jgi:hypothetical protein